MKLRYVGETNLYGLVVNETYTVTVFSKNGFIWVQVEGRATAIPYDTPQAFARNWKK